MAKSRSYHRNSKGQFSHGGSLVTQGRAGGFANAGHRQKALQARQQPRPGRRFGVSKATTRKAARLAGAVAAVGLAGALSSHGANKRMASRVMRAAVKSIPKGV